MIITGRNAFNCTAMQKCECSLSSASWAQLHTSVPAKAEVRGITEMWNWAQSKQEFTQRGNHKRSFKSMWHFLIKHVFQTFFFFFTLTQIYLIFSHGKRVAVSGASSSLRTYCFSFILCQSLQLPRVLSWWRATFKKPIYKDWIDIDSMYTGTWFFYN